MAIFTSLDEIRLDRPQVVTIGVFDGVHRGHQYLLARAAEVAVRTDAEVMAVTFWPPPLAVLAPTTSVRCLMTLEEKVAALQLLPIVHNVVILPFTHEFAALSAATFVDQLQQSLPLVAFVEGEDFTLGHNREGTVSWLQQYGNEHHFQVESVVRMDEEATPISSTRIRKLLDAGDVQNAQHLLSRPYMLAGTVVHGDARGRTLGYPTANLATHPLKLIPANGIYAVHAWRETTPEIVWQGAASIGTRPVFQGIDRRVEVYLFDVDLDLYDENLVCTFEKYVRPEMPFATVEALIQQMGNDVAQIRQFLSVAQEMGS